LLKAIVNGDKTPMNTRMTELLLQILLIGTVVVAVKAIAVLSSKRGFSLLPSVLLLGVILGPTVFNLFGAPLLPAGLDWHENTAAAGLMEILVGLGMIQLVFTAGALTNFDDLKKHGAAFVLSGLAIFLIPAALSIVVLKVFGVSWALALATASVVSVGSAALAATAKKGEGEFSIIAPGAAMMTFIPGSILAITAAGLRFEPTYGAAMTAIGVLYFFLKGFLLVAAAFFVGRFYLKRLAGHNTLSRTIQGVVGFVLLFALFYAWAAWSVGQIAALPIAFVFGSLFARSKFELKDSAIRVLSKPDAWLISIFFLVFGLSADFREIQAQIGLFLLLLAATVVGKISGAILGARITEKTTGDGLDLAARTFPIGEAGLILAFFAYGRGSLPPEMFTIAVAIITVTTFAAPFLSRFGQIKMREKPSLIERAGKRSSMPGLGKAG
jgi:Kef-type K+ transport system membrane component KefB